MATQEGQFGDTSGLVAQELDLMLARLETERDASAPEYRSLHRRLLAFFESHGSLEPGRRADETLDRLARKLREGHVIRDVPTYAHGLARSVQRDELRRARGEAGAHSAPRALPPPPVADVLLWDGFDRCLARLERDRAELLVAYYAAARGSRRAWRVELAASRGLSLNALRIRVFEAREALREGLAHRLSGVERR
jgi:DNA-directed RNA polymerase specialized sigma24 family protein